MSDKHNLSEIRLFIKNLRTFLMKSAEEYLDRSGIPFHEFTRIPTEQILTTIEERGTTHEVTNAVCGLYAVKAISEGHVFLVPLSDVLSAVTNFGTFTKIALEEQAMLDANNDKFFLHLPYEEAIFILYNYDEHKIVKPIVCCSAFQSESSDTQGSETIDVLIAMNDHEFNSGIFKIEDPNIRRRITHFILRTIIAMIDKGVFNKTIDSLSKLKKERAKKAQKIGKEVTYSGDITYLTSRSEGGRGSGTRQGGTVAAHWVRGHLKRCKTGIYWWNAHIAGSGEVKKRTAYKL